VVGSFSPTSGSFTAYTTSPFAISTTGNHTLTFVGSNKTHSRRRCWPTIRLSFQTISTRMAALTEPLPPQPLTVPRGAPLGPLLTVEGSALLWDQTRRIASILVRDISPRTLESTVCPWM
jgi:hypothetical protein